VLPNINRQKEGKEFFDEGVKFSSLKTVGTSIWPGFVTWLTCLVTVFKILL